VLYLSLAPASAPVQAILGKHLAQLNSESVSQAFAESLTDVTLQLYTALLEKLPPTPSRFHYVFNLRDLSRVYEGLLRSTPATVQAPADFLRLWRNEVRACRLLVPLREIRLAEAA
jgi:dynein heavy chain